MPTSRLPLSTATSAGTFFTDSDSVVAIARPGVDKDHLLVAVAHEGIRQGRLVLWTATTTLVRHLLAAKRNLRLPRTLPQLDRYAFLVLSDIGCAQHDQDERESSFPR